MGWLLSSTLSQHECNTMRFDRSRAGPMCQFQTFPADVPVAAAPKLFSQAGMALPSVVGAMAATPCLVQERFPRAHLVRVLGAIAPATVDPSASSGTASRRGTSEIRRYTRGQFILFGNAPASRSVYVAAAATVASRVKRNSVPSRHIRCSTTPIRRAKPTVARFFPRR
jgi:hypothetical protein